MEHLKFLIFFFFFFFFFFLGGGGLPVKPDIIWGYRADAGPSLCSWKNSEYPTGRDFDFFHLKTD